MAWATEHVAGRFKGLDTWNTGDVLEALWGGQSRALAACVAALPALERSVDRAVARLGAGDGKLVYAGAGSSGLIAALDAAELSPTFGWPASRLAVLAAGGLDFSRPCDQGAEDDAAAGRASAAALGPDDVVIGISASGASPFTLAVIGEARNLGALTVALTSAADGALVRAAEDKLIVPTGAEVIAGSTRLGAGTAQKVMLNLFSTALMVGLGLVFDNLMLNVQADNAKLRQRRAGIVAAIAGVDAATAADALARHGDVKRAVLALAGLAGAEIDSALARSGGNLRAALHQVRR